MALDLIKSTTILEESLVSYPEFNSLFENVEKTSEGSINTQVLTSLNENNYP